MLLLAWRLMVMALMVVMVVVLLLHLLGVVLQGIRREGWLPLLLLLVVVGRLQLGLLWVGAPAAVLVGPRTCRGGSRRGGWGVAGNGGSSGGHESSHRTMAAVLSPPGAPCILLLPALVSPHTGAYHYLSR